ncbi:MAG TPA: alpha/beta hydrolase domain-containing protein [Vicinamibacterales bacterium]|nr:alpha/beta hydrolase domain-containing protein [Vicinamibacterales bacterium]
MVPCLRRFPLVVLAALLAVAGSSEAGVTRLDITRREAVLNGTWFGAAGPYEKLSGTVHFALDPRAPRNAGIVDLALAPQNAQGLVEFTADFYLLKPVDPGRGNGRLFYEAGNRGTKRILPVFQNATNAVDPATAAEFGDGALMRQGFTLLWMGWQWDVPAGRMRMAIPIATDNGQPITGLVRGNFIPGANATSASVADRGHDAYPVVDPASPGHVMYVRTLPADTPAVVPRARWRFSGPATVTLDGGFEAGRIYDVVYTARDPRVVGVGLAGTRDLISFFKHAPAAAGNPAPGLRHALGWGVSQTGRFLRHFVYQGFNEDEQGRIVFDGVFDQVGGAGRGSFNHRFGQQSRDQLQHFNIQYPVDMFPFTDGDQTDPVTGLTDGLLARAQRTGTVPKFVHLLTNSEYFNRAGSLVHTDVAGARDVPPPETSRIYMVSSAPHIVGPFPPAPFTDQDFLGRADMNPLVYTPVIRAVFRALDEWVANGTAPPANRYPMLADGTLTTPSAAGWPAVPGFALPQAPMTTYRLDFGPGWAQGRVTREPPGLGAPFVSLVPAVDDAGNGRGGIRLPQIAAPLATHTGWNYRHPSIGAPDRLASEIGSYLPLPRTRADRQRTGDGRPSIAERYASREDYLGRIALAAVALVQERYLLADDVPELITQAAAHYDWATR